MVRNPFTSRRKVRLPLAQNNSILSQGRKRRKGAILRTGLILGGASLGGLALFAFLAIGPFAGGGGGAEQTAPVASAPGAEASGTVTAVAGEETDAQDGMQTAQNDTDQAVGAAKPRVGGDEGPQGAVTTAAEMPADDDPRWGDAGGATTASMRSSSDSELGRALSALGQTEQQRGNAASAISGFLEPDANRADAGAQVPVAESEDDILALEELQRQENAMLIASIGEDGAGYVADDEVAGGATATVTAHVNMRAGPSNSANIVTIVPANADVQSSEQCPQQWCEVTYEGQSGYVYQGYVQHAAQ